MSSEQIGRLFKPFQQIENSLTKSHEGTGLGLSISNMLAVLMGGDIQVSSGRGRGSEFVLQLPLKTLPGAEFERNTDDLAPAAGERRLTGIRVLVADDVSINRTIAKALLEAEGAVVTTVDNGSEAADAVLNRAEKGFDAVLMDLEMPRMNGRQAARRIRAMGKTVAIIGLTAHASEDERRASLASGMNDQLVKPVMQDSLVRMILHYLESV